MIWDKNKFEDWVEGDPEEDKYLYQQLQGYFNLLKEETGGVMYLRSKDNNKDIIRVKPVKNRISYIF